MEITVTGDNYVTLEENGAEVTVRMIPTTQGAVVTLEPENCDLDGEAPGRYVASPIAGDTPTTR